MVFNSLIFVLFFILVTTFYFLLPHKYRWALLLLASSIFYMYFLPIYILILGFTICIDYYAGVFIAKAKGNARRRWLVLSIIANVGVLAVFKYYNFLNDSLTTFLGLFNYYNSIPFLHILLPVGLSFHTFQAMSYTIEVYRKNQEPENHFGIYALYVMFYPQLVAGPIERPQNILHQFHEKKRFEYAQVTEGLKLILWGFVKKIIVADRLAIYTDAVYGNYQHHSGVSMIIASFFFIFQIYCDFSGYSDIAIGCARVMGINLMTNFRRPFFAKSIQEVWQRWHISLTTWFRDYVYFPLGGSRKGKVILLRNLLIVFAISGLWHGAGWTFVIWGLLNGTVLVIEHLMSPVLRKVHAFFGIFQNGVRIFFTVSLFVAMAVFFRAPKIDQSWAMLKAMFTLKPGHIYKGEPPTAFAYCVFALVLLLSVEFIQEYFPKHDPMNHQRIAVRYGFYTFLVTALLMTGVFNGGQFVYFQF
ncbi:MAG: MBOAT family protein [Bacteroidetes bacterium]|nr:MBOAT family protein [Bacteroidota bacterium]